ncbi:hypothetical protein JJB97_04950 [Enterobacterales bacterium BIT-L3]|uniref:Uncharacterized protein n=2 Tax=Tenebrionibacter/Tenebrionicola group TaxID=2969848 RepID=A0A8K0XVX6_9ENTR|nr:hypothetical protein [Tenebrionibacter intestinalis]MBV5095160.1 hypothetical protein [Tenebrionicola larvae]
MIVIEGLKVSNMSKSAKGMAAQHGRNARAESGRHCAIRERGWYEMRRQLHGGGEALAISSAYTRQRYAWVRSAAGGQKIFQPGCESGVSGRCR